MLFLCGMKTVNIISGRIYKTTFINGKIYIGQNSENNLEINDPFYMGSFDNHTVYEDLKNNSNWNCQTPYYTRRKVIWESNETTRNELSKKEIELIKEFKSYLPEVGYNRNKFKSL